MGFTTYSVTDDCETDPAIESLDSLYDGLVSSSDPHASVIVEHDSGFALEASNDVLVWHNVELGEPQMMRNVSRDRVVHLWHRLAAGDIGAINTESWIEGYG